MPPQLPRQNPQPARESYGPEELFLFPRYTRAKFQEAFGEAPPPYNPSRRIQRWWDTSIDPNSPDPILYEYIGLDRAGKPAMLTFAISAKDASTPNLPGAYVYPKYTPPPTEGYILSVYDNTKNPINPQYLSTRENADALAVELGVDPNTLFETSLQGPYVAIYPSSESRRQWNLTLQGASYNVGNLLMQRHAAGFNAPGAWQIVNGVPSWLSSINPDTGEMDMRPEIPMPSRKLLPNEVLKSGFGGLINVQRTDFASTQPLSGGLTTTQAEQLARIDKNATTILKIVAGI